MFRHPKNQEEISSFQDICQIDGLPRSQGAIDNLRHKGLLAVTPDGKVLGGASYFVYPSGSKASIDALAIHPNHQGAGIGRDIITFLVSCLSESGIAQLEVVPTGRSTGFYLKCGFEEANDGGFEYVRRVA